MDKRSDPTQDPVRRSWKAFREAIGTSFFGTAAQVPVPITIVQERKGPGQRTARSMKWPITALLLFAFPMLSAAQDIQTFEFINQSGSASMTEDARKAIYELSASLHEKGMASFDGDLVKLKVGDDVDEGQVLSALNSLGHGTFASAGGRSSGDGGSQHRKKK